jgi:hypothetical protein
VSDAGQSSSLMHRALEPELLDSLPHDHPDAVHNRRDLRVINRFMRNRAWFERTLPSVLRAGDRVLELGAGTGEMGIALSGRGIAVDGLDLWPRPKAWPADREWHQADLKTFAGYAAYPAVIGNLIFHQFSEAELGVLGAALRPTARVVIACEPQRRKMSQTIMAAVGPLLGANHVTMHDARVSIRAGFQGDELPIALGMADGMWDFSCTTTALGALRMVASRRI